MNKIGMILDVGNDDSVINYSIRQRRPNALTSRRYERVTQDTIVEELFRVILDPLNKNLLNKVVEMIKIFEFKRVEMMEIDKLKFGKLSQEVIKIMMGIRNEMEVMIRYLKIIDFLLSFSVNKNGNNGVYNNCYIFRLIDHIFKNYGENGEILNFLYGMIRKNQDTLMKYVLDEWSLFQLYKLSILEMIQSLKSDEDEKEEEEAEPNNEMCNESSGRNALPLLFLQTINPVVAACAATGTTAAVVPCNIINFQECPEQMTVFQDEDALLPPQQYADLFNLNHHVLPSNTQETKKKWRRFHKLKQWFKRRIGSKKEKMKKRVISAHYYS
ncbi:hypothetical protein KAFR_0A06390 [Kazachstania africana CBS 2517]|uniref:Uncharacterized protein n=1 Tax=Kazachstania africana (strain ATCC 22294 / BCRC 22015 / CBS 2517 / CECT 1963 / NBRC 1671 / NRRL Y-8276) TaxID=1071382 RepID=H2ANX4_KAZAF|nr:hypothetical protein KAFR_0A06390 [Kazachstania africana CBS 2517]CCF56074.1 hypothetical protein KAFR_0A06390 [Kazachstania africana CBS 2517]